MEAESGIALQWLYNGHIQANYHFKEIIRKLETETKALGLDYLGGAGEKISPAIGLDLLEEDPDTIRETPKAGRVLKI